MSETMVLHWSTLPIDILTTITKTLQTDIDLLRLRSVCSHWRSSLPPPLTPFSFPLKLPPILLLPNWCNPNPPNSYLLLTQNSVYRLSHPESSNAWLFKVSETCIKNTFSLLVPVSTQKIRSPLHSLNLLDHRISEICRSYSLEIVDLDNCNLEKPRFDAVKKVIVLWNYVADCALAVLVALHYVGSVFCWKFGDDEWIEIDTCGYQFDDWVFFDGKCYAVARTGAVVWFNSELKLIEFDDSSAVSTGYPLIRQYYLVECESELYVVAKIFSPGPEYFLDYAAVMETLSLYPPLKLKLFKNCGGEWVNLRSLGQNVLFLGEDVSFGVTVEGFCTGFKGNCIFFTDGFLHNDDDEGNVCGFDTGVGDMELESVESLRVAQDYAKLFWPPPTWIMRLASSP